MINIEFHVTLFLTIAGLLFALFIASNDHIRRRDLKNKEIENNKDKVEYMIKSIQERNTFLRADLVAMQLSKNIVPYIKERIPKQFQQLKDEILSVKSKLAVYHGADADITILKRQVNAMIGFSRLVDDYIYHEDYESLIKTSDDIEKRCRWFTKCSYPIDDKKPQ